ncbi:hypothetical protein, partial [Stenomitos frigidus]|uniref:hypothetical protein n=1 Tax=Stenomitos frigidus TaxID=1886765 RepID=UPI001C632B15
LKVSLGRESTIFSCVVVHAVHDDFVPNFRFTLHVGSHSPPGVLRVLAGQGFQLPAVLSFPILGKPINPCRLVHDDDGSNVDSLSLALSSYARRDSQLGFE